MALFAASLVLGVTFVLAGLAKVRDRRSLAADVEAFTGLHPLSARFVAFTLPVAELALGAMLLTSTVSTLAFGLSVAMLIVFTGAVLRNVVKGRQVSCACFGGGRDRPVGADTVMRNLALLAVGGFALTLSLTPAGPLNLPPSGQRLPIAIGTLAGLLVVAVAASAIRVRESLRRWQMEGSTS